MLLYKFEVNWVIIYRLIVWGKKFKLIKSCCSWGKNMILCMKILVLFLIYNYYLLNCVLWVFKCVRGNNKILIV